MYLVSTKIIEYMMLLNRFNILKSFLKDRATLKTGVIASSSHTERLYAVILNCNNMNMYFWAAFIWSKMHIHIIPTLGQWDFIMFLKVNVLLQLKRAILWC